MFLFALLLTLSSPGNRDATALFNSAIAEVKKAGGGRIELESGDYHFYVESATPRVFHVSNHDQPATRAIFLPLEEVENLHIKGKGKVRLIPHGAGTALLLNETKNVFIENVTIEWEKPFFAQATILGFEDGATRIRFLARDQVSLEKDRLVLIGEGWRTGLYVGILFDGATHAVLPKTGDLGVPAAVAGEEGSFLLQKDFSTLGAKVGDVFVLRTYARPHPVICLNRAVDTYFKQVAFRDGFGMGVLAQLSENLHFIGCSCTPRSAEEYSSNTVDAIHCSNCRGRIEVVDSTFEGMMDDALNVHSTALAIRERKDAHTILCRYMHGQAYGLDLFRVGEDVRFIAGKTLENGPTRKIKGVVNVSDREVLLSFTESIPEVYQSGDAIENASWQPRVIFSRNTVKNNRARGVLFTTPKSVRCFDNTFDHVSGSAILLAGDAQGWYESGACQDVIIARNRFVSCLTSSYQYCLGIISIYPEVRDLAAQKKPYHGNIRIVDNRVEGSDAQFLYAVSAENVICRDNLGVE